MALSFRIEGEGPPLVLVHGMGVTFSIWEQLAPLLSPHYKLIMVELPGNGASPDSPAGRKYYEYGAEALEDLRVRLDIERWNILGYSLGAWVVQAYLMRYPERAERAVFLCPGITNPFWAVNFRVLSRVDGRFPQLGNWILKGWRLHGVVRLLGFNGRNPPMAAAWTREISGQPLATTKAALNDLPGAGRAPFDLPALPVRFIWGDRDVVTLPPRPFRPVDRLIRADHSAPVSAAAEVAEMVMEFFEQE